MKRVWCLSLTVVLFVCFSGSLCFSEEQVVKIGLNYPETGPYAKEGKDEWYGAELARLEINAAGGIMGRKIVFRWYDSASNPDQSKGNVSRAIDAEHVKMVFGGVSSAVSIAAGKICQEKNVPYFAAFSYASATTGVEGHRYIFRECYDGFMAAKALGSFLKKSFPNSKFFYITSDYAFGWDTEAAIRKSSDTENKSKHPEILMPFPSGYYDEALKKAEAENAEVLVLVLGGDELVNAVRKAEQMGLKRKMQVVVPTLNLGMAERSTPKAMEHVIGALPWCWNVPYKYDYKRGMEFVENYKRRFNRYPGSASASAYTILWEYKEAVERAGTFDTAKVIKALEGHTYQSLKDKQYWRDFDHQSIQTVYAVRCNPAEVVLKDRYHLDYFEIIGSIPGDYAAISREEWNAARRAAGKPTQYEKLPGE